MSLSIELRGFDKFREFCREFPLKARIVLDEFSNEAAKLIAQRARARAPVRTGRLRSSIKAIQERVEAQAFYAKFVEYGTRKMKAQPFLRPAVSESIEDLKRVLLSDLQDMFRRELR